MLREDPLAKKSKKVVFCIPTLTKPHQATLDSLAASIPLITEAGWEEGTVYEIGCPYISAARSKMLRKALDAGADVIVFIDHDVSWDPQDLLQLIETEGDVVAGTYRFKRDEVEYMGSLLVDEQGKPKVRDDGCVLAHSIPAGFLKITKEGVNKFMAAYPELCYGERYHPCVDLFNHGAHQWTWWGEDYAFARRWRERCGEVWIVPNLNIAHHGDKAYPGNYHEYLLACPGGSRDPRKAESCSSI
jgi:glycosyltransferase involved in cell wall biosynthesis